MNTVSSKPQKQLTELPIDSVAFECSCPTLTQLNYTLSGLHAGFQSLGNMMVMIMPRP